MRIAVTGGSGFIGQATIAAAQARGHEAWTFDRSDGNDIMGSLDDLRDAQAVIHLAGVLGTAELFDHLEEAIQINIAGSARVMDWCRGNNAQYVGILMPDVFPSLYTATKIATQRIATALHHSGRLRCNHVRAFNVYGPGQKYGAGHPQKVVPTFAVHAWNRAPIPIWGDGSQVVDLVHADDIGQMLVRAAELPGDNRVYDGGSGIAQTVLQVARRVAYHAEWDTPEFNHLPMRAGEEPTYDMRARAEGWAEMGWSPPRLNHGLQETVRWYKQVPLEPPAAP